MWTFSGEVIVDVKHDNAFVKKGSYDPGLVITAEAKAAIAPVPRLEWNLVRGLSVVNYL